MIRTLRRLLSRNPKTDGMGRSTDNHRIGLGQLGERIAVKLLKHDGYRILERNLRVRSGEADIVCLDPDERTIVIVEVKARLRTTPSAPRPEDAVTKAKQQTLTRIARDVRTARGYTDRPIRIDVIGLDFDERKQLLQARHIKAAVKGWI